MSSLKLYNLKGEAVGDVEIAEELLVLDRGDQAVHDAVVAHLDRARAGTASTLTKSAVAGSGRKPWRQKGTGRARAGYRQSPVWRGGGVAHGPHPRDFGTKINRKVNRLAFQRAFSERVTAGDIRVVEELSLPEPRTRLFNDVLKGLGISKSALFIVDRMERNVTLASRNIAQVEFVRASDVSVYQVLRHPVIVMTCAALDAVKARLGADQGAVQ